MRPLALRAACVCLCLSLGLLISAQVLAQTEADVEVDDAQEEVEERDEIFGPDDLQITTPREIPGVDEINVVGTVSSVTDVQDEAQAVTAFDMEDLDKAEITGADKLAFSVPGLHVGQQGNQVIVTLRGIGTENASVTGEPGVAYMVDGVNYARPAAAQVAFFDLEGVEVLRGPQGTKGGKNTTAGWINVHTRKPHDDFETIFDYQVGAYEQKRGRGSINIPINEYAKTRFAFFWEDRNGYQRNRFLNDEDRDAFDADDFGFRGHLDLTPSEALNLLTTYNYYKQNGNGAQVKLIPQPDTPLDAFARPECIAETGGTTNLPLNLACNIITRPILPGTNFGPQEGRVADSRLLFQEDAILADRAPNIDNAFWGVTTIATWDVPSLPWFGETQLKGIGSFQRTDVFTQVDFDASNLNDQRLDLAENSKQTSGELQWSSEGNDLVDWQASLFFLRETSESDLLLGDLVFEFQSNGALEFDEIPGDQSVENKSYGFSLHTNWSLTDNVQLELGGRYSKDVRSIRLLRENTGALARPGLELVTCTGAFFDGDVDGLPDTGPLGGNQEVAIPTCEQTFRHGTGGGVINWRPDFLEDSLLYASVARGYKAGGFGNLGFGEYDPEFVWSYEIGAKNTFFDDRLTANLAAFFYDYKDLQLTVIDGLAFRTENADADVYGAELEIEANPFDEMLINATFGYLETELLDYVSIDPTNTRQIIDFESCRQFPTLGRAGIDPGCGELTDFSGNVLSRAPEWKISSGAEYTSFTVDYGSFTPRVQYYWQTDAFYRAFNAPPDKQETYHLTDVKLSWRSPEERYSLEIFVNNIEDDSVFQNVLVGPAEVSSPSLAWYGAPRTWGIRAGFVH